MTPYTPLTEDAVRKIAAKYYEEQKDTARRQTKPTLHLIGGQPGAGKSAVSEMVRGELRSKGGYVLVDADRLREQIPLARGSRPASEQTQTDAGRLVLAVRELAIDGKRHIVEEGTFRNPDSAEAFIKARKEQGYKVELLAVATARESSLLGIYSRHEKQHALGTSNPRMVPEKYHDDAMRGFDSTVDRVAHSLDRIRVVNRNATILYDSEKGRDNIHTSPQQALAAGRTLNADSFAVISKTWTAVEEAARNRGAPAPYIESVREHAQRTQVMQKALSSDQETSPQDAALKRAEAFRTMPEADALQKHPELKPAYQALKVAHIQFTARNPGVSASVDGAVMQDLRDKMSDHLKTGALVKPVDLESTRQPVRPERER